MSELLWESATSLAEKVRSGEVSSRELVQESLNRIDEVEDKLNAFVIVDPDGALKQADSIQPGDQRPFAGVPIAIKDLGPALAGKRLSFGSDLLSDFTPMHDSNVVHRIKQAGFVILGKTNTPEMGIVSTTEPRRHGATHNPWDLSRSPGGSSGGSAAAVAAGILPIAHANDGGGSIRIPAACCGLVGLKPARNRVSQAPELAESMLVQDLAVTHTVQDTARILDVLAGYELGDANWAPAPTEPFAEAAKRTPRKLRVALLHESPIDLPISPECVDGLKKTGELLEGLGHEVISDVPAPWKVPDLMGTFTTLWSAMVAMSVRFGALLGGHTEPKEDLLEPLTWELYNRGKEISSLDFMQTVMHLQVLSRSIVTALNDYDVVVTPTLAEEPIKLGEIDTCADDPWASFMRAAQFTPHTAVCNLTGQPAISLPLFQHQNGLPLGMHFIGRPAYEATLLSLASQLEEALPWVNRRPSL